MEIRELTLKEIEGIYTARMEKDFPPSELRPFSSIRQLTEAGRYRSYGCFEEGLGGYATFAMAPRSPGLLLDYLAVDAARRGQGIGTRFLTGLRQEAARLGAGYLLIEVESLESAQTPAQTHERQKRIGFYKGCGCEETKVYSHLFGVEYQILTLPIAPPTPTDDEVEAALAQVYHIIVPPLAGEGEEAYARVCRCFRR